MEGGARGRPAMSIMALMAGGLSPSRRGRLAAAAAATAAGCHRPDQARAGLADAQRDGGPGGAAAAGEGGNCGSGDGKRGGGGEGGGDGRRRHRARRRLARRACAPPHVRGGLVRPGRARWVCAPQPPGIIHDDRHDRWMRRAVAKGGGRGREVVCPCRARSTSLLFSQQPTRPRLITRAAHACCPVKNVAAFLADMARLGTWTLIRFQSVCRVFCHFASCTSRGPLSRSLVWCHSMRPRATQGPSTVAGTPRRSPRAADGPRAGRAARWSGAPQPPTGQKSHGCAARGVGAGWQDAAARRPGYCRHPQRCGSVLGPPFTMPTWAAGRCTCRPSPPPRYTRGRRLAGNWTCASNGWLVAARRRDGKRPLHAETPSLHRRARRDSGGRGGPARPLIHLACRWRERPPWPPRGGVVVVARRGGRHGV